MRSARPPRGGSPTAHPHLVLTIAADFGESVRLLAEQPSIGAKYDGSRTPVVRRLFLSRVGYFVYYRADATELKVLAFWHASRERQPAV